MNIDTTTVRETLGRGFGINDSWIIRQGQEAFRSLIDAAQDEEGNLIPDATIHFSKLERLVLQLWGPFSDEEFADAVIKFHQATPVADSKAISSNLSYE